jgi:hypothetical protein
MKRRPIWLLGGGRFSETKNGGEGQSHSVGGNFLPDDRHDLHPHKRALARTRQPPREAA